MIHDNYTLLKIFPNDNIPQNWLKITHQKNRIINKHDQGLILIFYLLLLSSFLIRNWDKVRSISYLSFFSFFADLSIAIFKKRWFMLEGKEYSGP